jgi:hypothetical protein
MAPKSSNSSLSGSQKTTINDSSPRVTAIVMARGIAGSIARVRRLV